DLVRKAFQDLRGPGRFRAGRRGRPHGAGAPLGGRARAAPGGRRPPRRAGRHRLGGPRHGGPPPPRFPRLRRGPGVRRGPALPLAARRHRGGGVPRARGPRGGGSHGRRAAGRAGPRAGDPLRARRARGGGARLPAGVVHAGRQRDEGRHRRRGGASGHAGDRGAQLRRRRRRPAPLRARPQRGGRHAGHRQPPPGDAGDGAQVPALARPRDRPARRRRCAPLARHRGARGPL
ncbi:MAG: hypothetical protein AVDCRST_MAG89-1493, partial [uncultured Gemmatimonadetes bacterium]